MEEMLDVYTRDGKYLGVKTRSECHTENPGFYHKPAWTWVYNSKNEILVQKRAMCKKKICWILGYGMCRTRCCRRNS